MARSQPSDIAIPHPNDRHGCNLYVRNKKKRGNQKWSHTSRRQSNALPGDRHPILNLHDKKHVYGNVNAGPKW